MDYSTKMPFKDYIALKATYAGRDVHQFAVKYMKSLGIKLDARNLKSQKFE